MGRRLRLVPALLSLVAALVVLPGPRAAAAEPAEVQINTSPVLFTYTNTLVLPTLHLRARLVGGALGVPGVPGETLIFSVGAKPTPDDPDGGTELCRGTTDAYGVVQCTQPRATVGVLLAILAGGAWVSHPATDGYSFAVTRAPLAAPYCDSIFCSA